MPSSRRGSGSGPSPVAPTVTGATPRRAAAPATAAVVVDADAAPTTVSDHVGTPNGAASLEPAPPRQAAPHRESAAHGEAAKRSEPTPLAIEAAPSHAAKPETIDSSRRAPKTSEAVVDVAPAISSSGVLFTRQSPLISVETAGPRTIVIGKDATYLVTIKNSGEVAAQEVAVSIKIPEWTDVIGSQATSGTARVVSTDTAEPFQWKIPRLDAHGKETLTLKLVPRKGRSFDLGVQWTFSPIGSQTLVDVQEPKLTMTIAGADEITFGQSKIYRLTLANPGTGDAENVIVELAPVGNAAAAATKHSIGTVRAGDSKVIELELTARQSGTLSVKASATAEPGLQTEATQEVLVRRAAVAVAIDGAKSRYAGTMAAYTMQLTNPGNATAENVKVTAALPQGAKFVSASAGGQYRADQGKVVWSVPAIKAGGDAALEMKCTLATPGPNRVQVTTAAAADVGDMATFTTNVEALADLKLDVIDPAGPIAVGDEVVYEMHVRNRGTKSAEAVGIVAYFSAGIEPISAQGGAHDIANGVVAFHPLESLAPGAEIIYKIHARADKSGKQVFRAETECGALGTKLVSATEMMIYSGDVTNEAHADHAVARRLAPEAQPAAASKDAGATLFHR